MIRDLLDSHYRGYQRTEYKTHPSCKQLIYFVSRKEIYCFHHTYVTYAKLTAATNVRTTR